MQLCRDRNSCDPEPSAPNKPVAAWTKPLAVWQKVDEWRHLDPEKLMGKCPDSIDLAAIFGPVRKRTGTPFQPPSGSWAPHQKLTKQQEKEYNERFQFKPF